VDAGDPPVQAVHGVAAVLDRGRGSTGPASSTASWITRAEHVRRPSVPTESPTLGFTHLQFEALLTAARQSAKRCDFALVAMLAFCLARRSTLTLCGAGCWSSGRPACLTMPAGWLVVD
jgi:hypothetical protein